MEMKRVRAFLTFTIVFKEIKKDVLPGGEDCIYKTII